jgi:hypothetical protein
MKWKTPSELAFAAWNSPNGWCTETSSPASKSPELSVSTVVTPLTLSHPQSALPTNGKITPAFAHNQAIPNVLSHSPEVFGSKFQSLEPILRPLKRKAEDDEESCIKRARADSNNGIVRPRPPTYSTKPNLHLPSRRLPQTSR